jgi:thiol-disulfide isomerase/thioredoxin
MTDERIRAPELPENLEWYNTPAPITLASQRGKVVLLDFWTYCCVNCQHVLPDLRYLEDKYPDTLTVIGMHSPKFPNERVSPQLHKAIKRLHIRHPVAHDPEFLAWRAYGIRAWPSIIYIDPEGYVVGVLAGEGRRRQLDEMIRASLDDASARGIIAPKPLTLQSEKEAGDLLCFPGKVHATTDRVYLSNSGRNQVLELNPAGRVLRCFGSGSPLLLDGQCEDASFNNPQGLLRRNDHLYIADAGNHAVRRIHLPSGEVTTIAGTGTQGRFDTQLRADPLQTALNSPWDLAWRDGVLYIAMAGQHQIWALPVVTNQLEIVAGSAREGIADGPAAQATLAQPSGLTMAYDSLYFADAETSALRAVRLMLNTVVTCVGTGLFDFGDLDGIGKAARLQHPQGLDFDKTSNSIYIADTFNNKIRRYDIPSRSLTSLAPELPLNEPGGLCICDGVLWVANTNDHQLLRIDLASGQGRVVDVESGS